MLRSKFRWLLIVMVVFSFFAYEKGVSQVLAEDFLVNDDTGIAGQYEPVIDLDRKGNFVICWWDDRNLNPDMFLQRFYSTGIAWGSNVEVNDDTTVNAQRFPNLAMALSGNTVVVWRDERNGNSDIFAQHFDSLGIALGSNFRVNTDTGTAPQGAPTVALDSSGNFVICWRDDRNGNSDIYIQRYDASGIALDTNFKANDDTGTADQFGPPIAMHGSGSFVVCWQDERYGGNAVYAQRFSPSGVALGTNFRVSDDTGVAFHVHQDIAMDASGNFVISWRDTRNGDYDIYAQRFSSGGVAVDTNFRVNDDTGAADQSHQDIAMDDSGNFVITWQDNRNNDWDIYAQRYDRYGFPIGDNHMVPDPLYASSNTQESPTVCANTSHLYFAWEDGRRQAEADIYAKILDWNWTACLAIPGDANASGTYTLADAIAIFNYVINKPGCSPLPLCWLFGLLCRGDWDGSTTVTLGDAIRGVNHIFKKPGGPWNALPIGACCLAAP